MAERSGAAPHSISCTSDVLPNKFKETRQVAKRSKFSFSVGAGNVFIVQGPFLTSHSYGALAHVVKIRKGIL